MGIETLYKYSQPQKITSIIIVKTGYLLQDKGKIVSLKYMYNLTIIN